MMEKLLFTLIDALNFGDKKKKKQNGPVWEHVLILDRKFHINPGAKEHKIEQSVFCCSSEMPSIFEYRLLTCLFRCLCKIFSSVSGLTTSCSLFEPRLIKYQPRTNPGLTNDMLSRANTVLESASSLMKIIVPDQKSSSFIEHSKVIDILPIKTHTS